MSRAGELSIVLHTHMPYVEGFGTWPFGEEWLWEAIASCYVPVLDVLRRADPPAPVTLSLTPVLADQLEAPGVIDRCLAFLEGMRRETHALDLAVARDPGETAALEHSAAQYERAAAVLRDLDGDLLGALAPFVSWTSAATHPVLPLLATDAGVRLQVQTGIAAHRRRFGDWGGGFWLPECAHAGWLDPLLERCGVHAVCVDLSAVDGIDPTRPLRGAGGPLLAPLDREVIDLVWSRGGYPSHGAYRDYHHRTAHHHRARAVDGAPYDPGRADAAAREHAADFVARACARVAGGGLSVCALDTELLGHWWHEGARWLEHVLAEARVQGLRIAPLDEALERHSPAPAPPLPVTTWGAGRDLRTWNGPRVADLTARARRAELAVLAAGSPGPRAVRELLALQASDWAFVVSEELAAEYGAERAAGHAGALEAALAQPGRQEAALRGLAPDLGANWLRGR